MPSIATIESPTDFTVIKYYESFELETVLLEIKEATIDQADRAAN